MMVNQTPHGEAIIVTLQTRIHDPEHRMGREGIEYWEAMC